MKLSSNIVTKWRRVGTRPTAPRPSCGLQHHFASSLERSPAVLLDCIRTWRRSSPARHVQSSYCSQRHPCYLYLMRLTVSWVYTNAAGSRVLRSVTLFIYTTARDGDNWRMTTEFQLHASSHSTPETILTLLRDSRDWTSRGMSRMNVARTSGSQTQQMN